LNVREATPEELADWDARAVQAPGGHVLQSSAWADHRQRSGWEPRFLVTDDGGRILSLTRRWPFVGGGSAYVPRGPVGGDAAVLAARQIAVAEWLAADGVDVVAADPEVPATETGFREAIQRTGFRPIEEIQPSRHRISLPLDGRTEDEIFDGVSKSTRQRIRKAESDLDPIIRHDRRAASDPGEGFDAPAELPAIALDRFYDMLLATGERRHFTFGPRAAFLGWWQAALAAGHLVYLEARGSAGVPIAGLVLYRHGGRLSTVHSGDDAEGRIDHPGALHLLRWRAIQLAIREGCTEMDLGGADAAGARHEPRAGDALYGLYQHKAAFGGRWLELTGAHERVFDARGYRLGRVAARLGRLVGR
jgi:lipid II:glycine glycyltransferase (peptidoglycan interpeptide bridge formation enzyme)